MELKFKLTLEDYLAWGKHYRTSRKTKPGLALQMVVGIVAGGLWIALDRIPSSGILPAALVTTFFWVAVVLIAAKLQRKNMFDVDGQTLGETLYRIENGGFRVVKRHSETLYAWEGFQAIEQSPKHVFLKIDRSIAFVFPKRVFISDAIRESFLAEVRFRAKLPEGTETDSASQQKPASKALTALAAGYFLAAAIMAFFTLVSGLFNADVQSAMADAFAGGDADEQWFLQVFRYGSWAVWILELALTLLFLLTGFNLLRRKSRKLCLVAAAVVCPVFPAGTLLGVFTFVALLRPEIKAEFDTTDNSTPA